MELPKWAFKAESVVRADSQIDMVFTLRPLGRVWMIWTAFVDLVRTSRITISIGFQEGRPVVSHDGDRIEPSLDYTLEDAEIADLVLRIPLSKLAYARHLVDAREKIPPRSVGL